MDVVDTPAGEPRREGMCSIEQKLRSCRGEDAPTPVGLGMAVTSQCRRRATE
jgi:hypothetical protein